MTNDPREARGVIIKPGVMTSKLSLKPQPQTTASKQSTIPFIFTRSVHRTMSDTKESSFNILGSSKLNTVDGKNPPSSSTASTQPGNASGQRDTDYRKQCQSAHDALENKLRDEEREKKWSGKW